MNAQSTLPEAIRQRQPQLIRAQIPQGPPKAIDFQKALGELGYGAVASASASTAPPSEDAPSEGSPSGSKAAGAFEQELEAVLDADLPPWF